MLSWKAKPQPGHHEEWSSGYGKTKPGHILPCGCDVQGALHTVERHMKGHHLVFVVTAGCSGLAARCNRVCLEPGSMVGTMLLWCSWLGRPQLAFYHGVGLCSH